MDYRPSGNRYEVKSIFIEETSEIQRDTVVRSLLQG